MKVIYSDITRPEIIEGMCRWAGPRIGTSYDPRLTWGISVICDDGCATVLYNEYYPGIDIRVHAAGEGTWLNRTTLDIFFGWPFRDLGLRRVSAVAAKKNHKSRNLIKKLGFVEEGCVRKGAENGDNLILFGILKEECRWLKEVENESTKAA